jgi:hypothetical protein
VKTLNRYKRNNINPGHILIRDRDSDIIINYNTTDRLDLMSMRYYDTPDYWWILLAANEFDFEYDIPDGELLRIPMPLVRVLEDVESSLVR